MHLFFVLAMMLAAPGPQEKPPAKEGVVREAALEAIRSAKPVGEDSKVGAAASSRGSDSATKGSGSQSGPARSTGSGLPSFRAGGGKSSSQAPKAPAPAATKITDADKKISSLFVANALYQQELANRKQIISISEIATPEAALAELYAGNERFVNGARVRTLLAAQDSDLRFELAKGQHPFAVVVTCSDSRTNEGVIFDQELGRLFSVRTAGNSLDTLGVASIEYSVENLGSKVVIIMGHSQCGAVGAVADAKGGQLPHNFFIFQDVMAGLLDVVPRDPNETDEGYKGRLEQENARRQAQTLYSRSKVIRERVDGGKIWLVPASYDIETGKVTLFKMVEANPHAGIGSGHE
jgi:carbonic anhydrase